MFNRRYLAFGLPVLVLLFAIAHGIFASRVTRSSFQMEAVAHCNVWIEPGRDTIQSAINRAAHGETLCLKRGDYYGDYTTPDDRALTLTGSPFGTSGWSRILVDCGPPAPPPQQLAGPGMPDTVRADGSYVIASDSSYMATWYGSSKWPEYSGVWTGVNVWTGVRVPEYAEQLAGPVTTIMNMSYDCVPGTQPTR